MGYSVHLYRKEVRDQQQKSHDESFLEKEENLLPFTPEQYEHLRKRLETYDYHQTRSIRASKGDQIFFLKDDNGVRAEALLTGSGLYFSTNWSDDDIFEICLNAGEFTDTEEFVKYDPQTGEWEMMGSAYPLVQLNSKKKSSRKQSKPTTKSPLFPPLPRIEQCMLCGSTENLRNYGATKTFYCLSCMDKHPDYFSDS